jgi:hypothetical protein
LFSFVTLLSRDKCKDTINTEYVKYNPLLWNISFITPKHSV